jgi:DNA (cytosine-5)-methyltransferase 1
MPPKSKKHFLRVGTDCSGIEAPIQALQNLGVPFQHQWSCEIDKFARASILANYEPDILFEDMLERNVADLPDIDLYVCGFPCQSFSVAGYRKGLSDPRGNLFFKCLEVLEAKQPSFFILENVRGLLSIHEGTVFPMMLEALEETGYTVSWKILNTRDYGVPQNRERVFIVGVHQSLQQTFKFPEPKPTELEDILEYVEWSQTTQCRVPSYAENVVERCKKDAVFIDFGYRHPNRSFPNAHRWSCCLVANSQLWNVPLHRFATMKELLVLQGFPPTFNQVVSNTQLKKQIGNSMSVNVLEALLEALFR